MLHDYQKAFVLENYQSIGKLITDMGYRNTWVTSDHYDFKKSIRMGKSTTHKLGILFCYHLLQKDVNFFQKENWKYGKYFIGNGKKGLTGFAYFINQLVLDENIEEITRIIENI